MTKRQLLVALAVVARGVHHQPTSPTRTTLMSAPPTNREDARRIMKRALVREQRAVRLRGATAGSRFEALARVSAAG
jgi:hypothetical protein